MNFRIKNTAIWVLSIIIMLTLGISCAEKEETIKTGNVIFIHPDGSGASMWGALRMLKYGPDGMSNWDKLERMGLYRAHVLNSTNSSSHGGATIHSYGVKVKYDTYGNTEEKPVKSLSGTNESILVEVQKAGMATALINSGHICEPGTGVFAANSPKRDMTDNISEQIINSGVDIIFSGGEKLLLPEGVIGKHGEAGVRRDGKNLIEAAIENGYKVIYTRDELMALSPDVEKVLGVFAAKHTFNDYSEERLRNDELPIYYDYAPTVAEMTDAALNILEKKGKQFFMVVEEEGTDNFANNNNASGTLEAISRADDAIGVALDFMKKNPKTLIITAADSDAGGMQMTAIRDSEQFDKPLPLIAENGAPLDGIDGAGSRPFTAAPDAHGTRLRFGIVWSCYDDVAGAIIARAHGLNSHLLENNVDNTDIYRVMYATLFGKVLPKYIETVK
ncbi:MAG: alkaline phosphatase [candidate division Zixibacteria bacterium]|nr:alkaline phosphatase [candidate division Zixibacteria bacterium]